MPSILEEAIGRSHPCQKKARRNVWSHPTTKKGCRCWKALNIFYFCSIEKRSLPVLKKRLILSSNHRLRPSKRSYYDGSKVIAESKVMRYFQSALKDDIVHCRYR